MDKREKGEEKVNGRGRREKVEGQGNKERTKKLYIIENKESIINTETSG